METHPQTKHGRAISKPVHVTCTHRSPLPSPLPEFRPLVFPSLLALPAAAEAKLEGKGDGMVLRKTRSSEPRGCHVELRGGEVKEMCDQGRNWRAAGYRCLVVQSESSRVGKVPLIECQYAHLRPNFVSEGRCRVVKSNG